MRVIVPRVTMVDGTRQGMELLQRDSESHPHIGGDEVPTNHAEMKDGYSIKRTKQCWFPFHFFLYLERKNDRKQLQ